MTDPLVIELRGLAVFAHHGVHDFEKEQGQTFRIDVRLVPVSARACETDRLVDAIDYGAVASVAVDVATGRRFDLIERLAAAIGDALLARFRLVRATVTVHKPQAPLEVAFDDVVVTVERFSARDLGDS
jgi:dihydroneopterin aldolase